MQHLRCACAVALLSARVEKVFQVWHPGLSETKAEVVVVALLKFPIFLRCLETRGEI